MKANVFHYLLFGSTPLRQPWHLCRLLSSSMYPISTKVLFHILQPSHLWTPSVSSPPGSPFRTLFINLLSSFLITSRTVAVLLFLYLLLYPRLAVCYSYSPLLVRRCGLIPFQNVGHYY